MKNLLLLIAIFSFSLGHTQLTISSNDVEEIYTQAIDARFAGDLAKSRNLLENLKENNFTNEFVMSLLVEVYGEYLTQLIQTDNRETFQIAYPGIRQNIAEIWDLYPNSESIQNNGLKISWITGDQAMGNLMVNIVLNKDPFNVLANYILGMYLFTTQDYGNSVPFFKKVACSNKLIGNESYIFQARLYLGDIYLEQNAQLEALKFYHKALELNSTIDLVAKIAVLEAYRMNIQESLNLLQTIPALLMTPELYDTYTAVSWFSNSRPIVNQLLTQNIFSSKLIDSLIQAQLGRTQGALKLLEEDIFLKKELPGLYYKIKLQLASRIGDKINKYDAEKNLGRFYYQINDFDTAKFYLQDLDRNLDTEGEIAHTLSLIAQKEWDYHQARIFQIESLSKKKSFRNYTDLIEIEASLKNFTRAEQLLEEAIQECNLDSMWIKTLQTYITFAQNRLQETEQLLLELTSIFSNSQPIELFLASVYVKQEQYNKAEELILKQYHYDPYNINIKNQLAYYYAVVEKELDTALNLALSVVEEEPDDIIYLDTLAWIYTIRQEYDSAQAIFKNIEEKLQTISFMPNSEELYAHLGFYYAKTGNQQLSEEYFQKGFAVNPTDIYIQKLYEKRNDK
ncbi:MAG: tetratricopeptide repeat protein [Brevinema sp.]